MGGQVAAAAVEGHRSPAAAEGGPTAVVVLQSEQPGDAAHGGRFDRFALRLRGRADNRPQGQQRGGGVVGVGGAPVASFSPSLPAAIA